MTETKKIIPTEAETKAVEKLRSLQPGFGDWRKARAAEEAIVAVANNDIGYEMPDGTIYAGISPDTGKPLYAAPADSSVILDFNKAAKYAEGLEVGGKKDFRLPTKAELNVLFENRERGALKGTFDISGAFHPGWYRSSTLENAVSAWSQRFSDGQQLFCLKANDSSVRCVR